MRGHPLWLAVGAGILLLPFVYASSPEAEPHAQDPLSLQSRTPAVNYDWDEVEVGQVLAVGVPSPDPRGPNDCSFAPRITMSITLDPDGAVGAGKALTTAPASGCRIVVASKSLIVDGHEQDRQDPEGAPLQQAAEPLVSDQEVRIYTNGPVNTCGPASTKGLHSDLGEELKGTSFMVTARLRYLYDECTVTVRATSSWCTYDPARGVLFNCSSGTTVHANPVAHEIWGAYGENASANRVDLHTVAEGYVRGTGRCWYEVSNTWGEWPNPKHCYFIDPDSV